MPVRLRTRFLLGFSLLASCSSLWAQRGDKKGVEMQEIWRDFDLPPAPVVPPAQALKTFRIAPGFRIELVAAEPMVKNPVALAWDGNARMWVVEMVGYMPDVDGTGEATLENGRVSVLEDVDGDGAMDKSTVFLDHLILPRALSLVHGGVLVASPPNLYFCKDTDGDLVCDSQTIVSSFAKVAPVEHTDNALLPALDNWIYNANSSRAFQFRDGRLIERKTPSRGQWGLTQDNYGRLFYNNNSRYLYGDWHTYQNLGKKIADVLTYVRHSWGNNYYPVSPGEVSRIRKLSSDRSLPYEMADLLKFK